MFGLGRFRRASEIPAKMNQLQDPVVIRELYRASQAGVPISLNVRGLCCLKPGVTGLPESIRVFSVLGLFLEHGRIYRFENGGAPELLIGSADWMRRNLAHRRRPHPHGRSVSGEVPDLLSPRTSRARAPPARSARRTRAR